jgi:hypothetical protein
MPHPNIAYREYLQKLAQEIEAGQKPEIINAKTTHEGYNFGDLAALEWAEFHQEEGSRVSTVKHWWSYTGPNSIMCDGNELSTGDTTDPIEEADDADEEIH